jgi:predicted AlkP superfamily phosphohydrolase/phosphomutase
VNERVVLIGLDGGEPALLEPLLVDLPHLRRLRDEGAWGRLRSTVPPLSPPAWATLMTGLNPGKHGVFDFYHMPLRARGSYVRRLITSAQWRAPALWDRLAAHGLRAGFVNMPICWPPPTAAELFVCGLGTPPGDDVVFTHPAALGAELAGALLEPGDGTTAADPAAFLARCEASGASMLEVAERLWHGHALDLYCVALTLPDRLQHVYWRELEAGEPRVTGVYRRWLAALDAFVGRVLAAAGPETTVVLFSDHGFGPVRRYFHVNRWLLGRGYLQLHDRTRLGGPDGLLGAIDWSRTSAYCLSEYGDIRLNLRGREPQGIVAPGAEADALVARLGADLRALDDGLPGPAVDEVLTGAQVYHGPFAAEAPDLIARLRDHETLCRIDGRGTDLRDADGPLFVPADRPEHYRGAHRRDGLLALWGGSVRHTAAPFTAAAADLCPTVLHCLGLPLDRAFDGRVLRELLAGPLAACASVHEDGIVAASAGADPGGYAPDEEERVTEHLRQLGYVE